ncbi:hypothetical protein ACIF9R_27175 [Streptomyces sp. NPDC086080]|uniref:hypothetical protein n=1 Tax=Streptomyces sp. NPDC086080 TaxID=3365748 RepID=UPI0037D934E1
MAGVLQDSSFKKFFDGYLPVANGHCSTVSVSFGISLSVSGCGITEFGGEDSGAFTVTPSIGLGGVEASWTIDEMYSNADDVSQLSGWAGQLDVNAGEGPNVHSSIGIGGTRNKKGALVYAAQVGGGYGLNWIPPMVPMNVTAGVGYTFLWPFK